MQSAAHSNELQRQHTPGLNEGASFSPMRVLGWTPPSTTRHVSDTSLQRGFHVGKYTMHKGVVSLPIHDEVQIAVGRVI